MSRLLTYTYFLPVWVSICWMPLQDYWAGKHFICQIQKQIIKQQLIHKKGGRMFKRCHRLKKSHIKIPTCLQQTSLGKKSQASETGKQNITINYAYSNVELTQSIQLTKSQTLISSANRSRKCPGFAKHSSSIDKVKSLCSQIETLNQKISMYKDILAAKESRHSRNRASKMEEKEKILARMIEDYQLQRQENELLIKQLGLAMGQKSSFSLERRTTATFHFYAEG